MDFPLDIISNIDSLKDNIDRTVTLNHGLTVILGPNGSGKTHLLRGMRKDLERRMENGKAVRFMSAGRMGPLENYRSDFDGHRNHNPLYANAQFGSKGDLARRHKNETLNGDFQTLSERVDIFVMIQERLQKLLHRNMEINWDGGELKVDFSRTDVVAPAYSSGREASGLLHLVGILCAVYNDEYGALLIDEPEVSLHPQLQAFLLGEMQRVCGTPQPNGNQKIIVIATHSTELVQLASTADLPSIVFCYDLRNAPVQVQASAGELANKKIRNLVARLGQEHKLALFSKRPLLVEGPSDSIVCSALSRRLELHLEAAGSQLLPVIGTGQMPVVVKFMRMLGKAPVVLADADAVADGLELANEFVAHDSAAQRMAEDLGFSSPQHLLATGYSSFCNAVDQEWPTIAPHAKKHPYWLTKSADADELQTKRRAVFGTLFSKHPGILATVDGNATLRGAKAQLNVLLCFLEKLGCFILRLGTIECYYQVSDPAISIEKASAAVEEMAHIQALSATDARTHYADIVRCIQKASDARPIIEAEALRDILLSIAAPAVASLRTPGADSTALQNMARNILRERSKLFGLTVAGASVTITLESKVLHVPGFPLTLNCDDDVVKEVNKALGLSVPSAAAQMWGRDC